MEHADALERIEIAAVEPEGLERLMAGDTPDAAAVAGHLAGCPSCAAEMARIRRTSALVRDAIRSLPDPALRERTLTFVREVGRDRSAASSDARPDPVAAPVAAAVLAPASVTAPAAMPPPVSIAAARSRRWGRVLAGLAAAVVIAGTLGFAAGGGLRAPATGTAGEVAVLSAATGATVRIEAMPDAARVTLAAAGGGPAAGTLLFSPSGGELVMLASGLAPAPAGMEYACWVEAGGVRRRIGRMYAGGSMQAWAGPVDGLASLAAGTVFGVSLAPVGGGQGEPVLTGRL